MPTSSASRACESVGCARRSLSPSDAPPSGVPRHRANDYVSSLRLPCLRHSYALQPQELVHHFDHFLGSDQWAQGFVEFGSQFSLLILVPTEIGQFLKQGVECLRFHAVRSGGRDSNRFIDRERILV